jgi:hypothetical protein
MKCLCSLIHFCLLQDLGGGVHSIIRRSVLTRVAMVANVSTDSLKTHDLSHATAVTVGCDSRHTNRNWKEMN